MVNFPIFIPIQNYALLTSYEAVFEDIISQLHTNSVINSVVVRYVVPRRENLVYQRDIKGYMINFESLKLEILIYGKFRFLVEVENVYGKN